jgi:hypothetical protein
MFGTALVALDLSPAAPTASRALGQGAGRVLVPAHLRLPFPAPIPDSGHVENPAAVTRA